MIEVKNATTISRACIKCREYVIVEPNNPKNQEGIKIFEEKHKGHTLITLELDEVKGKYKKVNL